MSEVTLFSYAGLDNQTKDNLKASAERIRLRMKRTSEDIVAIGHELSRAKALLGHGAFGSWIDVEFGLTERMAQRFMGVSDRLGSKSDIMSDLTPTVLYELAAPSTPNAVVERVQEKVASGESVSVLEVKQLKADAARLKAEAESAYDRGRQSMQGEVEVSERKVREAEDRAKAAEDRARKVREEVEAAQANLNTAISEARAAAHAEANARLERDGAKVTESARVELSEIEARKRRAAAEIERCRSVVENLKSQEQEHRNFLNEITSNQWAAKEQREALVAFQSALVDFMLFWSGSEHSLQPDNARLSRETLKAAEQSVEVLRSVSSVDNGFSLEVKQTIQDVLLDVEFENLSKAPGNQHSLPDDYERKLG